MMQAFAKWLREDARPFVSPDTCDAMLDWDIGLIHDTSLQAVDRMQSRLASIDFRSELPQARLANARASRQPGRLVAVAAVRSEGREADANARPKIYAETHSLPLT
jgi:hypothetical protein